MRVPRWFLRCNRYLFLAIGILALGYCGFVLLDARLYQAYQGRQFEQALKDLKPSVVSDEGPDPTPVPPALADGSRARVKHDVPAAIEGTPLGRMEIRTLGLAVMVLEGTGARTLRRAVGHIPGTALPGQHGNV